MHILRIAALSLLAIVIATTTASPAQTFTTLVTFSGTNGANGGAAPIQGQDGDLYGTTGGGANNSGIVYKMTPTGTLTTIYSFCAQAGCTDGSTPAGLLLGADGSFYGLTINGGSYGYGTVFTLTKGGTLTTLHSFDSTGGEGANPFGRLVQGSNGSFYGSTAWGAISRLASRGGAAGSSFKSLPVER